MTSLEVARRRADEMFGKDRASRELGIAIEVAEAGSASARMQITERMINGLGVCHGGYVFTLADSAFAFACNGYEHATFAAGASIQFVRSARLGDLLLAEAREQYRGRSRGVYDVKVSNQDGKVVALFRGQSHAAGVSAAPDSPVSDTETFEIDRKP
jgi:acyl-CoA thioesterase